MRGGGGGGVMLKLVDTGPRFVPLNLVPTPTKQLRRSGLRATVLLRCWELGGGGGGGDAETR